MITYVKKGAKAFLGALLSVAHAICADAPKTLENYQLSQPQLIMVTVGANDAKKVSDFYETVFGTPFAPSFGEKTTAVHCRPVSGLFLDIQSKYGEPADQSVITLHWSVPDLAQYEALFLSKGGTKVFPFKVNKFFSLPIAEDKIDLVKNSYYDLYELSPEHMTDNLGYCAIYKDCEGNRISLIKLEKWAHVYYAQGRLTGTECKEMILDFFRNRRLLPSGGVKNLFGILIYLM